MGASTTQATLKGTGRPQTIANWVSRGRLGQDSDPSKGQLPMSSAETGRVHIQQGCIVLHWKLDAGQKGKGVTGEGGKRGCAPENEHGGQELPRGTDIELLGKEGTYKNRPHCSSPQLMEGVLGASGGQLSPGQQVPSLCQGLEALMPAPARRGPSGVNPG